MEPEMEETISTTRKVLASFEYSTANRRLILGGYSNLEKVQRFAKFWLRAFLSTRQLIAALYSGATLEGNKETLQETVDI